MNEPWGKPDPPPIRKLDPDSRITSFEGWVESQTTSVKGVFKIVLAVPREDKWKAQLLVDQLGEMVYLSAYKVERTNDEVLAAVKQMEELEDQINNGETLDLSDD